jgi:predicted negative regulator of RcsB-dependent stress response
MAKKRVTRKELVKEPDEFITLTGKVIQWSRSNLKSLIYGICVFFGIILLISGYRFYSGQRAAAASALFSKSLIAYQEAEADKDPGKALNLVRPDFERLINEYGGTAEGRMGRMVYAHLLLNGHAVDEAIAAYEKALGDFNGDPSLRNTILDGLATAFMEKGDNGAAIGYLEKIVAGQSPMLKDSALFNLGRLYRQTGDAQKSQNAYSRLAADFPESMYAEMARESSAG